MSRVFLLDTGPLVAWLSRTEESHVWARRQFERLHPPAETCEAVLSEAAFLVRRHGGDSAVIMQLVERGILRCGFDLQAEAAAISQLMHKYASTPMSIADACLVRMSELHRDCELLTLDRDFQHYRRFGRSVIPLISPWTNGS